MSLYFFVTNLSKNEILNLTGYGQISELLKERSDAIKEILINRKYAPISKIRKSKFYVLHSEAYLKLAQKHSQVMLALNDGIYLKSIASFSVESQKRVFANVNATYQFGQMSDEIRKKYIEDLDKEFGEELVNLYESTK